MEGGKTTCKSTKEGISEKGRKETRHEKKE